jgi:hypothetical protein
MSVKLFAQGNNDLPLTWFEPIRLLVRCVNHSAMRYILALTFPLRFAVKAVQYVLTFDIYLLIFKYAPIYQILHYVTKKNQNKTRAVNYNF